MEADFVFYLHLHLVRLTIELTHRLCLLASKFHHLEAFHFRRRLGTATRVYL